MTADEWAFFEPFVIESGALRVDHLATIAGLSMRSSGSRSGAPWRDLLEELGIGTQCIGNIAAAASGLWDAMLDALAEGGGNAAVQMTHFTAVAEYQQ